MCNAHPPHHHHPDKRYSGWTTGPTSHPSFGRTRPMSLRWLSPYMPCNSNSWHVFSQVTRVFRLSMNTIQNMMGTLQGIQVKSPLRHQCHPHCHEVNHNHQKQKQHQHQHPHWWNYHDLDQVRAEAYVTDYFYNNTQKGWCETRIINNTLDLRLEWWQSL